MSYYFAKILDSGVDESVARVTDALKAEGFGILTTIDVQATLKSKLGVDFPSYRILGACNPALAHQALQIEDKVGTMLPCNVVVHSLADGRTEIAAIDPVASMQAIPNQQLREAAEQVREKLERVIATL
ncbi:MAG TPA: DUF302 domain-containing protein [Sphingomicrobium sp.]|nr:DUF302 domain-containing protein [Sphingomicrobium sp.]